MTDHATTIRCILIDQRRIVLLDIFHLKVPSDASYNVLLTFSRFAIPALRHKDNSVFKLYKPLANITHGLSELSEELIDLQAPPPQWHRLNLLVPPSGADHGVDIIIRVQIDDAPSIPLILLTSVATFGPLSHLTISLSVGMNINRPSSSELASNFFCERAVETPPFVTELDNRLLSRRSPAPNIQPAFYSQSVKDFLGVDYNTYFTDAMELQVGSASAQLLEFIHYNLIIFDVQMCDPTAYRACKASHIYSLLSRVTVGMERSEVIGFEKSWPFPLVVRQANDEVAYPPRNDFGISLGGLPVLLLEVASNPNEADRTRMLLQASCLVRLGQSMLRPGIPKFLVKAVYIDEHYCADEYTLFLREDLTDGVDPWVDHTKITFNLRSRSQTFKFIFRLYNFIHYSTTPFVDIFSPDIFHAISFAKNWGIAYRRNQSRNNSGTRSSRSRSTHTPTRGTSRSFEARGRILTRIAREQGYILLEANRRSTSTIAKAYKSGHVVAMKLLSNPTSELDILVELQVIKSAENHTIKLLYTHRYGHYDVVVMPWQLMLDDFLNESPTMVASMLDQFLEAVSFLHNHGYAHLDLKPGNVVVGCADRSFSPPRLSLIDYGISIRVMSEDIKVQGYRGTPLWTAPEVGTEDGPAMSYSPIRADRWSCGRMIEHMRTFHSIDDTVVQLVQNELLSSNPKTRPPLSKILDRLRAHSLNISH